MKNQSVRGNIDWIIIAIYIVLVVMGWLNIYSSSLPVEEDHVFSFSEFYGKQLIFIILTIPLIFVFVFYREGLPAWYLWTAFITIVLFIMTLVFEPHYVVLAALVIILLQYFRTRSAYRNPILSGMIFTVITGFVYSVNYVFENIFKQ